MQLKNISENHLAFSFHLRAQVGSVGSNWLPIMAVHIFDQVPKFYGILTRIARWDAIYFVK